MVDVRSNHFGSRSIGQILANSLGREFGWNLAEVRTFPGASAAADEAPEAPRFNG